jgi:ribosomal protein L12E/L44/L45/RPP1/RPP2
MEQLRLGNNEKIVKNYDYSTVTKGIFKKEVTTNSLTVTNRRIVLQSVSNHVASRKEIPVSSAEYVDATFAKNGRSLLKTILCGIITVAFLVGFFVINSKMNQTFGAEGINPVAMIFLVAAGVGLVLTAINVLVYIFSLGGAVLITIGGRRPEIELLTLGASNMVDAKGTDSIKIKVDRHVSETMVNELGAVIMNINDGAFEAAPAAPAAPAEEAAPAYEAPAEEAAEAVEA